MPPAYPKSAREVTVALRAQGIGPAEITRRLNEDQAGLGFAVPCSERTVKEWLAQHKAKHGPFTVPAAEDVDADSIAKYKARAFALICREIAYFETKHKGKLTRDQSRAIRQHFETLDSMERISERAALRRQQPSRAKRAGADAEPGKQRSAMDQLRDQMAESVGRDEDRPAQSPAADPQPTAASESSPQPLDQAA